MVGINGKPGIHVRWVTEDWALMYEATKERALMYEVTQVRTLMYGG